MLRRHARKVGVFVVGWLIVVIGLVLVLLPALGWAIVFVGLSLLATEFAWAAVLTEWVRKKLSAGMHKTQAWRAARRRRRLGVVDEVVDDVLEEVDRA
ncbi:MAG: PGPGW domain-containing protein [Actinomycetota bacterium]